MRSLFISKIFSLPRRVKLIIQVTTDITLIVVCFWTSMALRLDGIFTDIKPISWVTLAAVIPITIFTLLSFGLYRAVVRYMAERAVTLIVIGSAISATVMLATSQYFELQVPISVSGIYFALFVLSTGGTRLLMRTVYLASKDASCAPVAIYGAGEAGHLLMRSLQESKIYRPSIFIDDDTNLHGTNIAGIPIVSFEAAKKKISKDGINIALIAISENEGKDWRQPALRLTDLGLSVRRVPKISDLVSGQVNVSSLRQVKIEDLLSRDPVEADPTLMSHTVQGKSVLVTGAGGSIGSEISRQILTLAPRRVVLFEMSEYALYNLVEELNDAIKAQEYDVELVPVLGSVTQETVIESLIIDNAIETVFHAAAYKHVPLVEDNAAETVRNNVLGTRIMAQAAGRLGVNHFVLISTDKAVRPTNIMGATKRLAELALSEAAKAHFNTKFCSVRFGNVLGSSGSVVPKFEAQILQGRPLTLTHPDITRFFMTIQEAAQLVIQASSLADKAEVFVLDMGEPVRILDLAKTMCALYGKQLIIDGAKTETPPNAVNLEITGLRPGEKLHEELLVSGSEKNTQHPKVMCEKPSDDAIIDMETTINRILRLRTNSKIAEALEALPINYTADGIHHKLIKLKNGKSS